MNQSKVSKLVHGECDLLLRQGVLPSNVCDQIRSLYPRTTWDWHSLGRWFLFFGAVSVAAGGAMLAHEYFHFTLERLAVILILALIALYVGALRLKAKGMVLTGRALELLGALDLIGLSFTLGAIYSSGSGNWPALLLADLIIILPLAYLLHNVLILILSSVLFFIWFGGETGYVSGWGAYFFGMNYPLRFLCASAVIVGGAVLHLRSEKGVLAAYRGFFKVWLSTGLFFGEMSLWLLSIFGNYGAVDGPWHPTSTTELCFYNALWCLANAALIYVGSKEAMRMIVGYGGTFLIIQGYTLYFAHIAFFLPPVIAFALAGGVGLALVLHLERHFRQERTRSSGNS